MSVTIPGKFIPSPRLQRDLDAVKDAQKPRIVEGVKNYDCLGYVKNAEMLARDLPKQPITKYHWEIFGCMT